MTSYRDPKVTTPTADKSGAGKWIGIALAVLIALLLLAWLFGAFSSDEIETVPLTTEEPAETNETAPADDPVVVTEEEPVPSATPDPSAPATTPLAPIAPEATTTEPAAPAN